jgi:uncharacterized protein (DUF1501 family)
VAISHLQRRFEQERRRFLRNGIAFGTSAALPSVFDRALAAEPTNNRILVVLELSGGNDGLNTLVPYGDDLYYRHRPNLGIKRERLRRIDDHYGFSRGMAGFERLYKDGKLAVVHGCGYDDPSYSHFTSMAYWHTAAPNSGEEYGWVGRLGDAIQPKYQPNTIINIDTTQSLAVKSRVHVPVVFDDPERFLRRGNYQSRQVLDSISAEADGDDNATRSFLRQTARSALDSSALVRQAWANYKTPIDYGIFPIHLSKVASLIQAEFPTRLYYVAYRNNAFDTHVQQADLHERLLTYVSDAVAGFMRDLERIGKADQVAMMIFSEFGRRVPENANLGTDHGTANNVFVVGRGVKGGHYGDRVSLAKLDAGDNLIHTTDFRRAYATMIEGWLGTPSDAVLKGRHKPFPIFG